MTNDTAKQYRKRPSIAVKRKWIELFYKQGISVKSIADDYGYPIYTVYRVLEKMDPKKKPRADKGKKRGDAELELPDFDQLSLEGESPETQIELFIQSVLRSIAESKTVKASQALMYMNQFANALKKIRSLQFAAMAKSLDVEIVEEIIRTYEPEATDVRVIEVFKEAAARVKARRGD